MAQINKPDVISTLVRGGILPSFANDGAFEASKGSTGSEGDRYWNTGSNIVREYAGGAWRDQVATILGFKRAWGHITVPSGATTFSANIRSDLGVIQGATGGYNGDLNFTVQPAIMIAWPKVNPTVFHGVDFVTDADYAIIGINNLRVDIDLLGQDNRELFWLLVGT